MYVNIYIYMWPLNKIHLYAIYIIDRYVFDMYIYIHVYNIYLYDRATETEARM